jgi:hypothetical protein
MIAKCKHTLDKEAARIEALIRDAIGIKFPIVRRKSTGEFVRVGRLHAGERDPDLETIEVWEKDPCLRAFVELMDLALGEA